MSLRRRLLTGLILLGVLLIIADVAVARAVQGSLLDEVDRRLVSQEGGGPPGAARRGGPGGGPRGSEPPDAFRSVPGNEQFFFENRDQDGDLDYQVFPGSEHGQVAPDLDAATVVGHAAAPGARSAPFTVTAKDGVSWRIAVSSYPGGAGYLVRGLSLAALDSTYQAIVVIEVVATLVVIAGLCVVAWWVLRLGIRPLNEMSDTALAIAAGDTELRIPPAPEGTEAGKLSSSLNTMIHELDRARKEEEETSDRLRQFVSDASHELRTPLTSILGYSELLGRHEFDPEELSDILRRLDVEAHHMSVLVEELLLLARLDEGRPLEKAPVDLVPLVDDVAADLRAAEPGRPVVTHLPPTPCVVVGDEHRLRQVVVNLAENARLHTPPGTPVDLVVSGGLPANGSPPVVTITVADRGMGLPPGSEGRVFERFYRADPARSGPGNGLGLAIVDAICRAHGGHVDARNRAEGNGAEFVVTLPV